MLKERHEIDTNYNHLHLKFSQMQTDEHERKEKVKSIFTLLFPCPNFGKLISPPFNAKKLSIKYFVYENYFLSLTYFQFRALFCSFRGIFHDFSDFWKAFVWRFNYQDNEWRNRRLLRHDYHLLPFPRAWVFLEIYVDPSIFQYDHSRKHYLSELENHGQELCKEHARILHQVEHINWHLEGCTRHRPCMGRPNEPCHKKSVAPSNASCISSSAPTCNRPSAIVSQIHLHVHPSIRSII